MGSLWASRRRVEAVVVGAAVAVGILVSNAFTYHDTNLLPGERYDELLTIGERFGSARPALVPEFDELALYALQDLPPDGPGFSFKTEPLTSLADGSGTAYGQSYDLDQLRPEAVEAYETIVLRQRPDSSRPPTSFRRVYSGSYYDVWRRRDESRVVRHLPAGGPKQPGGRVSCGALRSAIARAGPDVALEFVERPKLVVVDPRVQRRSESWSEGPQGIGLYGPGRLDASVKVPEAGRYRVWVEGSIARKIRIDVNGAPAGSVSYESGNAGNYASPFEATLHEGRNQLAVERGGGSLAPGDNSPSSIAAIVLEPVVREQVLERADPSDWRSVCRRRVDWVDLVRAS